MKKGFVFSIDSALAVVIAAIIISGIYFNLFKGQQDLSGNLYSSKLTNDALITLNKNKILDTLNESTIKNRLNDILPDNLAFKLNVTVYECDDQACRNFVVVSGKNLYILSHNVTEEDSVSSKRMFLTFQDGRIKYFSIAELRAWLI